MTHILITGRLPELSIAELESLYGPAAVTRIGDHALVDAPVDFDRLGGSIKMATLLVTLDTTNPQKVFDYCRKALPDYIADLPDGKIKLGVSLYGMTMPLHKQNANVLTLKKTVKQCSRSVRAIPNTDPALSSAQTYHNSLTSPIGLELACVASEGKTYVGRVTNVQDIDSYTLRDRSRPKRDPFVGMLPPKLAQTIINLATPTPNSQIPTATTILDPFCGTGVILQEAALMGYDVYGTDHSPKMIDYTRANLKWLKKLESMGLRKFESTLKVADATSYNWELSSLTSHPSSLSVACEAYLGQPIGGQHPTDEKLREIIHACNVIMRGFLKNIATQIPVGTRLCIAAPAWHIDGSYHYLPVIDELTELGFMPISFTHAKTPLIYSRDDQLTHRQLLVLTKS